MNGVKTMAEYYANNETPEVLFWVGCAGSFDQRAIKVTKKFVEILNSCNVKFAILGQEESCTGDPARRAGNEFLFQMMAYNNIQILNNYNVKRIVTTCPHCFNTFKNEYPDLGGNYEVMHHTQYLQTLINEGLLKLTDTNEYKGKTITYHDSCYLGRANDIFEAPRSVLESLELNIVEMKSCKKKGFCCGAGGAQMFKEEENGKERINIKRTKEAIDTKANIIVANCPYCITMLEDGIKSYDENSKIDVFDITELITLK